METDKVEAVKGYLRRAGCATVEDLWNGLERRFTLAEIRAALKKTQAYPRKFGDWPKFKADGSRWRTWEYSPVERKSYLAVVPGGPFTLYRLEPWASQ